MEVLTNNYGIESESEYAGLQRSPTQRALIGTGTDETTDRPDHDLLRQMVAQSIKTNEYLRCILTQLQQTASPKTSRQGFDEAMRAAP